MYKSMTCGDVLESPWVKVWWEIACKVVVGNVTVSSNQDVTQSIDRLMKGLIDRVQKMCM